MRLTPTSRLEKRTSVERIAPGKSAQQLTSGASGFADTTREAFHVLDKGTQFRQGLASARIVEEDPRRCDGKGREQCFQATLGNRFPSERTGHLCKAKPLECRSQERGVVVRNQRPRHDCLDRLVAVDKGPGRDRPVRAAYAQAGVLA